MSESQYLTSALEAQADLQNYYRWVFDEIRPFFGRRLTEIGAGIGTFTQVLVHAHLSVTPEARLEVFEPSSSLYHRLEDTMQGQYSDLIHSERLVVTQGYFQDSTQRFDTVIMINVLEHILDDVESIRVVYQSLAPGGTLAVFVPALPWLYSALDKAVGHHRRYEKSQLERLFVSGGFDVVKARYMDCLGVLPWYLLNVLGGSRSINPQLARFYDTWCVPLTRRIEGRCNPFVGKNILMVGRKNAPASGELTPP